MAKKAKKKETKKKPDKPVENKQEAGEVTEEAGGHPENDEEDDFSGDDLKQLDKALKEADPGEPPTLEEFKKMSERMRNK